MGMPLLGHYDVIWVTCAHDFRQVYGRYVVYIWLLGIFIWNRWLLGFRFEWIDLDDLAKLDFIWIQLLIVILSLRWLCGRCNRWRLLLLLILHLDWLVVFRIGLWARFLVAHQGDHYLVTHSLRRRRPLGLLLRLMVRNGTISRYSCDCGGWLRVFISFKRVLSNVLFYPLSTLVRLFHGFVE